MDINTLVKTVLETDTIFFNDIYRADVKQKGKSDYVTRSDIEISNFLRKRLGEQFPEVGFMSEEDGATVPDTRDFFILDPIDGTTNFMHGFSACGVSLALCSGGELTMGVIYIPYAKEIFWAAKGCGAYLNGERIECSKNKHLSDCLGLCELNAYFKNEADEAMHHARQIYTSCQDVRLLGCAAAELGYIACGRADVFLGRHLKPWDFAAGAVIVKEAGGKLTNLDGELTVEKLNQHIVAANAFVFDEFKGLFE